VSSWCSQQLRRPQGTIDSSCRHVSAHEMIIFCPNTRTYTTSCLLRIKSWPRFTLANCQRNDMEIKKNSIQHKCSRNVSFFTFEYCILLLIYLTGSLWRRQSQQSFNTLTPFKFLFYSLLVSAPTGHPQEKYTISYYFCFLKDYFNTTDSLHVCDLEDHPDHHERIQIRYIL
jgi:hypothetical protein